MRRTEDRVTIQDIVRELSLSRNTVSKALKNSDDVSNETKQLVGKRHLKWDTASCHLRCLSSLI